MTSGTVAMNDPSIVIQRPQQPAEVLVLLFHGVGGLPQDLVPIAGPIAALQPSAFVASVAAPAASDLGRGRQWFSVIGVTEANRPTRVEAAMPSFMGAVSRWQQESGVGPDRTVLIGFSQGAIMALESTQRSPVSAASVVSIAGRFAVLPTVPPQASVHLVHGDADSVIPSLHSEFAAHRLAELGATVSLDLVPGLGHGIDEPALQHVLEGLAHLRDRLAGG